MSNSISPNTTTVTSIVDTLLVSVNEAGLWLNLSSGMITLQTTLITTLIETATELIEKETWLALRRTTYEANYDLSCGEYYELDIEDKKLMLERAPVISEDDISDITYLDTDGTYKVFSKGSTTVSGLYDSVTEKIEKREWASVYFIDPVEYDNRNNTNNLKIEFTAGYTPSTLPSPLKTAILMMVAFMYSNRGDCQETGCKIGGVMAPCAAAAIVSKYSIKNTIVGTSYEPFSCGDCSL